MKKGRIIIITGSPGTGKSTISSILAKESNMSKSVNMQTDDFYHYLSKGAIPPHLPESNKQNLNCRWDCRAMVFGAMESSCPRRLRGTLYCIKSEYGNKT